MLTRGRSVNHVYLHVVGDGDPHTVIRPDTVAPRISLPRVVPSHLDQQRVDHGGRIAPGP